MENEVKKISVDLIDEPVISMRSEMADEGISELALSIKEHGLINPITVRRNGERFEVVAGHRRFNACKRAGLVLVSCVIHDVDDREADILKAHENLVREDVNVVDEATFIGRLINERGYSVSDISKMLKRSEAWVQDRLDILYMPDYMQLALYHKKMSIGAALELVKITDDGYRRSLIEIAVKDGCSVATAERWFQMWKLQLLPPTPTSENLQPFTTKEPEAAAAVQCAKCGNAGLVRDSITVWVHKECPPEQ